jgi:AcrR family transcriptional regulator
MPRVTAQHEQAVRSRIVDAAIKVFGETGYQHATVQDVVRESGLSVGAVYTHFTSKEQLFLVACACAMEAQKTDLRLRMSEIGSVLDRLRAATDFAIESVLSNANERSVRVNAWQVADDSPDLRQILRERRGEMVGFARMILQEAVAGGELPGWIDVDSIASAFLSLIDGFVVRALEMGEVSVDEARRDVYSLLELLVAAPHDRPASVDALRVGRQATPA